MKVTQIVELSKKRSGIYLEQEFAFVLYKDELRRYHIREGEEFSVQDYHTIMKEVLPKRAKLRVMHLLKNKEYTTSQLRNKLKQGYYPEQVIEEALEYMASFHYTDDLRYAIDYITYNESRKSRNRMEQDLRNKGIPRELIEQAWKQWQDQGGQQDEQVLIENLLRKKNYKPQQTDFKEQQKLYAFLIRKGFCSEQIRKAMSLK